MNLILENLLLMGKKCIRGGICHFINQYLKANNKYMKDMIKMKELPIFNI